MRNGTQPVPRRDRIFPPMPTEKVRVRKTDGADPVAEDFKAAGKGNEAQPEQEKAHPVEGAARSREIRHDVVGVEDADEPDGDVDQEDPVPCGIRHQPAAEQRADHGADEAGNADEVEYGDQLGARVSPEHGQARHRHHHGSPDTLQHPRGDEHGKRGGQGAEQGTQNEEVHGGDEDAPCPEPVGQPAAHGDEHGDGEGIAHHGELHGQRGTVEAARHGGECRVKNGGVQCLHKKGGRRDGRQSNQFV